MGTLAVSSDAAARDAPDAVAPPPGNPRFPLFDGLRAIAALSIVVTHCASFTFFNVVNPLGAYTARMNAGVALFFVISGFLLYRPFLAARFAGRPLPAIRAYARRRILRVVPAYWLALTVLGLTVGLPGVFGERWWAFYGFLQIYDDQTVIGGIGPAWSLAIEMSFYAALPVWAFLMALTQRGRGRAKMIGIEVAGLLALSATSIAIRTWSFAAADGQTLWHTTLPGNLDWFAWGMGLAVASVAVQQRASQPAVLRAVGRWPGLCWSAAAAVFWALSTQMSMPRAFPPTFTPTQYLAEHLLFPVTGVLLALPAVFGHPDRGLVRRLLGTRILQWFGLVSYGVFLWHEPLLRRLARAGGEDLIPGMPFASLLLLTTLAATACAAASYYLLERPILRFKDGRRRSRPAEAVPAPASAG